MDIDGSSVASTLSTALHTWRVPSTLWRAFSPADLADRPPSLYGVMPEHSPAGLRHRLLRRNPLISANCTSLGMNGRDVGPEVTNQLLLLTEQPAIPAGFGRVLSGVWLLARHGRNSEQQLQDQKQRSQFLQ